MWTLVHKTVFFLILIYFIGWASGIMFIEGIFRGFLCIPMISLILITIFGSDLNQKNNHIFRAFSALFLVLNIGFAFYFMILSSEQSDVKIAFIGLFAIIFTMIIYLILKSIQIVQET